MPDSLKNVEISAAVGPSWANTSSTHLVVSPYETDSVLKSSVSNHPLWKLGVGYHFFVEQLQQRRFLNDLLVELNLYQSSATVKGSVWQYQFPQFNNYRFSNPITSTRLMVDAKPGLFTQNHISLYPILGIGAVWNDVTYSETVTGAGVAPNTRYSLNGTNNSNFAYDLGAGVRVDVTKHLSASLEYLYTHLGSMSSSRVSKNGDALQSAPTFNVYNQGVLLGVSWKI
ncbi:MAG: outer membrane beta-barrel protein [Gammaproteobacteria bacterium]|nr:outer membrane beta-barrel protein [Gammaproteobacteria bacterium]